MELPKGVHRVVSRGREYLYWAPGRGTKHAAKAIRLPDDPQSPEFWVKLREAQGAASTEALTINALVDLYETSQPFLTKISTGTRDQYRRGLRLAREAWGNLPADTLRPMHVQARIDRLADLPGKANTFLGAMRALSSWAISRGHIDRSITEAVTGYEKEGGHKPWTDEQIAAATEHLTGAVRRGVMLALYTGQRGSDVVRLGWTMVDEGGFSLGQQKTGVEVWCPIVTELATEMATWERVPGPFVRQENGRVYTRKLLSIHFREQADKIEALRGATLHGLRSTAVIRLRRAGLEIGQIEDIVGMSMAMIARYCRFADKKRSGQAAVVRLERHKNGA